MNFTGKVALITGASSGIGRATAIHFARLGAKLSLTGRSLEQLQASADLCYENGCEKDTILLLPYDLTKDESPKKIVDGTVGRFGRLDILVNNAGILRAGSIETTSMEQYDEVMNLNVRSVYSIMMVAVSHLKATKGNVVNVSSVNGLRSFPGVLSYCISKSALDQLTKCVALELAQYSIRVNSVNPGVIATNLQRNADKTEEEIKAFLEHSKTTHALGRVGTADEVASTITFLASDMASNITGVQLPCDGGRHALCPR